MPSGVAVPVIPSSIPVAIPPGCGAVYCPPDGGSPFTNVDYLAESANQASRATGAAADAIENGVGVVRHAAKQGCDAGEQFLNETTRRLQRHFVLNVARTFAVAPRQRRSSDGS